MFGKLVKVMPTVYAKYLVAVNMSAAGSFTIISLGAIAMISMMPATGLAWRLLSQVHGLSVNGNKVNET